MTAPAALVRGALAGSAATVVMSAFMLAAQRAGLVGEQPPEAIVRSAGAAVGNEPQGLTADALASLAHLGFGATVGAGYALLPDRRAGVPAAVATSLAVYAVSYQGWVPVLGALPRASRDRSDRQSVMVVAHVLFGAVLGRLDARWRR